MTARGAEAEQVGSKQLHSSAADAAVFTEKRWCGRRELNPHRPCGPTDFLTNCGFRRPRPRAIGAKAGLWSGLSLHRAPARGRGLGAARLVSTPSRRKFPSRLGSGLPSPACAGSPEFGQFCIAGSLKRGWCGGRESNPHSPCGPRDFKSLASTSSATPAY